MAEAPGSNATLQEVLAGADLFQAQGIGQGNIGAEGLYTEGNVGRKNQQAQEGYEQGNKEQTEGEPEAFRGIDARSNRGGILTSGFESRRTNTQVGRFANQRARRLETRKSLQQQYQEQGQGIYGEAAERRRTGIANKRNADTSYNLENPSLLAQTTVGAPPAPIPPAQQAAIRAGVQTGPGGVVPYAGSGPFGVRVGLKPRSQKVKR